MSYRLGDLSVMVVDDHDVTLELAQAILKRLGIHKVSLVKDGVTALERLRATDTDLIICDQAMQPLAGTDFVRRVRNDPDSPDPTVPIIMVTGYGDLETVVAARDSGVNELLVKPIDANLLHRRMVEVIERPRPFVRSPSYFGPDRRRRNLPFDGPDRRQPVAESQASAAPAAD